LKQQALEEHSRKMKEREKKLWVKRKSKTYCGRCIVYSERALSNCQQYFGLMMLLSIFIGVLLMFYIKAGQEAFTFQQGKDIVDLYGILEVPKGSSERDIRKAYRKMALRWHPDRNRDCGKKCTDKMAEMTEAYIILSNPETRTFHDRYGVKPPDQMIEIAKAKHGGRGARRD